MKFKEVLEKLRKVKLRTIVEICTATFCVLSCILFIITVKKSLRKTENVLNESAKNAPNDAIKNELGSSKSENIIKNGDLSIQNPNNDKNFPLKNKNQNSNSFITDNEKLPKNPNDTLVDNQVPKLEIEIIDKNGHNEQISDKKINSDSINKDNIPGQQAYPDYEYIDPNFDETNAINNLKGINTNDDLDLNKFGTNNQSRDSLDDSDDNEGLNTVSSNPTLTGNSDYSSGTDTNGSNLDSTLKTGKKKDNNKKNLATHIIGGTINYIKRACHKKSTDDVKKMFENLDYQEDFLQLATFFKGRFNFKLVFDSSKYEFSFKTDFEFYNLLTQNFKDKYEFREKIKDYFDDNKLFDYVKVKIKHSIIEKFFVIICEGIHCITKPKIKEIDFKENSALSKNLINSTLKFLKFETEIKNPENTFEHVSTQEGEGAAQKLFKITLTEVNEKIV
ncbi:hypothetical protein GVAV_001242 [Gurleya vavrai]